MVASSAKSSDATNATIALRRARERMLDTIYRQQRSHDHLLKLVAYCHMVLTIPIRFAGVHPS
jgi:hypothetical protein